MAGVTIVIYDRPYYGGMLGGEYRMVLNMRGIKDISHHKVFRYFSALQETSVGCKYHFSHQVRCDHKTFSVRKTC